MSDYYYILADGSYVHSKWDKAIGDKHLSSKIVERTTKELFETVTELFEKRYKAYKAKARRDANREADLWFAGMLVKAGQDLKMEPELVMGTMKALAPNSYKAVKRL